MSAPTTSRVILPALVAAALILASCSSSARPAGQGNTTSSLPGAGYVDRARCSSINPKANADLVDISSHQLFSRLHLSCLGDETITEGLIYRGSLYVLLVPARRQAGYQIVEMSLRDYSTRSSSVLAGSSPALTVALGALWVKVDGKENMAHLIEISIRRLSVTADFAFPAAAVGPVAFGSDLLWATGTSLVALDPRLGTVSRVPVPRVPHGDTITGIAGAGSAVYLSLDGLQPDDELLAYKSGGRVVERVHVGEEDLAAFTTSGILWVEPPGGNWHFLVPFSTRSLRQVRGGANVGGINSSWGAWPGSGDVWLDRGGGPLECIDGRTSHVLATLRVPGPNPSGNISLNPSPNFIAAGDGFLVLAPAGLNGGELNGVAIYRLDPRCHP
jgi:hypothetical protein